MQKFYETSPTNYILSIIILSIITGLNSRKENKIELLLIFINHCCISSDSRSVDGVFEGDLLSRINLEIGDTLAERSAIRGEVPVSAVALSRLLSVHHA